MAADFFFVPGTTTYRAVGNELQVKQLETGGIHFFSLNTKDFLECFREPKEWGEFLSELGVADKPEQAAYLARFRDQLLEEKILQRARASAIESLLMSPVVAPRLSVMPAFLRTVEPITTTAHFSM